MSKKIDLTNQIFGKLTVISIAKHKNHSLYWLCKCECGNEKIIIGSNLKSGKSKSCGCMLKISKELVDKNVAILSTAKEVFRSNKYNDGDLTFEEFYNLSQMPCYYCKSEVNESCNITNRFISRNNNGKSVSKFALDNGYFQYNGLDRIDSSYKHNKNNVVTCCIFCNGFKLDTSLSNFKERVNSLYSEFNFKTIDNIKINNTIADFLKKYPEKNKKNKNLFLLKLQAIKNVAKNRRKLDFDLTKEQISQLITSNCVYCNYQPNKFNTIDRVDNNFGYIPNNCVSCCLYCNTAKNNKSLNNFINWKNKIKSNFI